MSESFRKFIIFYGWTYAIPLALSLTLAFYPNVFFPLHGGPFKFVDLLQNTIASSGVTLRGGALIPLFSAVSSEPVLVIAAMGSIIPALVAVVVTYKFSGGTGVKELLARLRPWIGVGAGSGVRTWMLLMVSVFALQLVVFATQSMTAGIFGWTVKFNPSLQTSHAVFFLLEAYFLNQGGLLEEMGFRGFALPALQNVMSPIKAALFLGVCWALWHVSRDILFQTPAQMGWGAYLLAFMPLFIVWCVGGSIIMAYFVNRTGGSVLAAIAVHGFLNDGALVSGVVEGGNPAGALIVRSVIVGLAGLFVFLLAGPELGRSRSAQEA